MNGPLRENLRALPFLAALLCCVPAHAGVWDFYGGVGLNGGRVDNPRFLGQVRAACLNPGAGDPNSPSYSASCDPNSGSFAPNNASSARRSDINGSLRLTGGVRAQWTSTHFDVAYAPVASFYDHNSRLNQITHHLSSNWSHNYSVRTALTLTETLSYIPEQDADPNAQSNNAVLSRATSSTTSNFRGTLNFAKSRRSGWSWSYREQERAYSSAAFVDSANHNAGAQYRRNITERGFLTTGYDYGYFTFSGGSSDPNTNAPDSHSQSHVVSAGYGYKAPRGLDFNFSGGYNLLYPGDPNAGTFSGLYVNGSVGWHGDRFSTANGYNHGFDHGGGAFSNSRSQIVYTTDRYDFSKTLRGEIYGSYNVNERLEGATASTLSDQTVRSFTSRATLTYQFAQDWDLFATYTRYEQSISRQGSVTPDVRSNRYFLGISWSFT